MTNKTCFHAGSLWKTTNWTLRRFGAILRFLPQSVFGAK